MFDEDHKPWAIPRQTIPSNRSEERNLSQPVRLRSGDSILFEWRNWCTQEPKIQNEILNIAANSIVKEIANKIRSQSQLQYSIIVISDTNNNNDLCVPIYE